MQFCNKDTNTILATWHDIGVFDIHSPADPTKVEQTYSSVQQYFDAKRISLENPTDPDSVARQLSIVLNAHVLDESGNGKAPLQQDSTAIPAQPAPKRKGRPTLDQMAQDVRDGSRQLSDYTPRTQEQILKRSPDLGSAAAPLPVTPAAAQPVAVAPPATTSPPAATPRRAARVKTVDAVMTNLCNHIHAASKAIADIASAAEEAQQAAAELQAKLNTIKQQVS